MSWIGADLETLPTMFFETTTEGQTDEVKISTFSGGYEQVTGYGSWMRRDYQITTGPLDATESAAFISFYSNHGNVTPFKFEYQSETIYVRFDGGYILDATYVSGIKKSARFSLKEKNPGEIIL